MFNLRDHQKCFDELEAIIMMAMHAYDLETLLALFSLRSQISLFFGHFQLAVKDLRKLNQVSDEIDTKAFKIGSYHLMGECFNSLKDYKMALKCHKK